MRNISLKSLGTGAIALFLAVCMPTASWASVNETNSPESIQQRGRTVRITVNDSQGPVIGANVLVKGTTNGSITDMDGVASIQNVPNDATILVSYIGYKTQEVAVGKNTSLIVTLKEDSEALEEVVVVGYGTQAKKDITGSVAVVSRDALQEQPVATFAEALQGKASGVYITSSGGPAGDTTIRVRGVGSMNGSDPLIIVDGVQGVDISSVNPNDIESFQVLKDASATAIYGARAANGVIIVTTKQGTKESKVRVSYNAYVSASQMANKGYNMLGAWDYMKAIQSSQENQVKYRGVPIDKITPHDQFGTIANGDLQMPYAIVPQGQSKAQMAAALGVSESDVYAAMVAGYLPDRTHSYALSSYYYIKDVLGGTEEEARRGTNWFDMITRTGISQNHELSVQGGGEKGQYSVSFGYSNRQGTVKNSSFERYNMRINTTYNVTKHITIGQNTNAALMKNTGERGSQGDGSPFGQTYTMNSWVPAYNVGGDFAGSVGNGGRNYSALANVENAKNDWSRNFRMQSAFFGEIKDPWIKGLSFRSQFAVTLNGGWSIGMTEDRTAYDKEFSTGSNEFTESASWGFGWQWTNTATYKRSFGDHNMTILAGTEAIKSGLGRNISGTRRFYDFQDDPNTWTLSTGGASYQTNSGGMGSKTTMFGLFARADYDYKGKYLVTATVRRDASSKFAAKNRWGTFPSVSVGWRMSDEKFLAKAHETWLDDLKIRAGYGTTGNSNIGAYNYAFQYGNNTRYMYGIAGNDTSANTGYGITNLGDSNAKWETVKMFNVGYDFTAFNNKLTSSFDFYIKSTSDMLVPASWTYLSGAGSKPNVNIGNMKNTGIDFSISYRDKIGKLGYNINANVSWYKNEVTKLGASNLFDPSGGRITQPTITTVGQPIGMFYGYVNDGIYQSVEDVLNYKNAKGEVVLPNGVANYNSLVQSADAWVGHFKWADTNNDGKITSDDRQIIGNPHPDITGGVNIGLNYGNWDLSTYFYYSLGNDMYKYYEYYTLWGALANCVSYERINEAWDPQTNPNGTLPLWVNGDTAPETAESHSHYICDGSYLRMQTLTLGYSLPKKLIKKVNLSKVRIYAQMSNVFTITNYEGLDPEVRQGNDRSKGLDYGSYGMPRQYLFGVNVNF